MLDPRLYSLAALAALPLNPKLHDVPAIAGAIDEFGFIDRIIVNEPTMHILGGHGRRTDLLRRFQRGEEPPVNCQWNEAGDDWLVPVDFVSIPAHKETAAAVALNRASERGGWHEPLLVQVLQDIATSTPDLMPATGYSRDDLDDLMRVTRIDGGPGNGRESDPPSVTPTHEDGALFRRFVVPPFSIFDTRQGYWRNRKSAWLSHRLDPGRGRQGEGHGGQAIFDRGAYGTMGGLPDVSIGDPVLAEVMFRWYCPPGGRVLDPFAGGPTWAFVAAVLGLEFVGIELNADQIAVNVEQLSTFDLPAMPEYIEGDCREMIGLRMVEPESFDFAITSPPYYNLERYGGGEADLSEAPSYDGFLDMYEAAMTATAAALKPDRFAVFMVGDVRGSDGLYYGFVADTIRLMDAAGLHLYNDAILLTQSGSLPARVSASFDSGRKLGKHHQNILIAVKGEPRAAVEAVGAVWLDGGPAIDNGTNT